MEVFFSGAFKMFVETFVEWVLLMPQRCCALQPNVAASAKLGMEAVTVVLNRNAVASRHRRTSINWRNRIRSHFLLIDLGVEFLRPLWIQPLQDSVLLEGAVLVAHVEVSNPQIVVR